VAVTITNYRELFAAVAKRSRMYLIREDFPTAVACIEGCDQGNAQAVLTGFREWRLTQVGCRDNTVRRSPVLRLPAPDRAEPPAVLAPGIDAQ
jgi:hypothetical protein